MAIREVLQGSALEIRPGERECVCVCVCVCVCSEGQQCMLYPEKRGEEAKERDRRGRRREI